MFGTACVQIWSVLQQSIALSSGEAEYYAAGLAAAHGIETQHMLEECGVKCRCVVLSDSAAALGMCHRLGAGRVRHMETRYVWPQTHVNSGKVQVNKVFGTRNAADVGTKVATPVMIQTLLPSCRWPATTRKVRGRRRNDAFLVLWSRCRLRA